METITSAEIKHHVAKKRAYIKSFRAFEYLCFRRDKGEMYLIIQGNGDYKWLHDHAIKCERLE